MYYDQLYQHRRPLLIFTPGSPEPMLESLTTHGMMDKSRLALCALLFTVIIITNTINIILCKSKTICRWCWRTPSPPCWTTLAASTRLRGRLLEGAYSGQRQPLPLPRSLWRMVRIWIKSSKTPRKSIECDFNSETQIIKSSTSSLLLSAFNIFILIAGW